MSSEFVHAPTETYEYVSNPSNVENPHWVPCTQADYYLFAQVVPVRVLVPTGGFNEHFTFTSAQGLPMPLASMKRVELFDEEEAKAAWKQNDDVGDPLFFEDWVAAWRGAVSSVKAKLPERLKNSLFVK